MRIAIFGATSQIAKDLILLISKKTSHELTLFARRPDAVVHWFNAIGFIGSCPIKKFEEFDADDHYDVIINFVGVGNPAQTLAMGASIFDITFKYDEMILEYLKLHHECRYIFLSSGAAYGSSFERPVGNHSVASISINDLLPQDWYAVSKLYAECRHRALPHLKIVDIRIFNYFSHTQDLSARFFITDLLRAIKSNETFLTSPDNIVRDYIGPDDFYQLINCIMKSSIKNDVVDCCSKAPIDKFTLLKILQKKFQLKYEFNRQPLMVNATGIKTNYYSVNKKVLDFGYQPRFTSLDLVVSEIAAYLTGTKPTSA